MWGGEGRGDGGGRGQNSQSAFFASVTRTAVLDRRAGSTLWHSATSSAASREVVHTCKILRYNKKEKRKGERERVGEVETEGEEAYLFLPFINGRGGGYEDTKELLAEQGSCGLVGELGLVVASEIQANNGLRHTHANMPSLFITINTLPLSFFFFFWLWRRGRKGEYHDSDRIIITNVNTTTAAACKALTNNTDNMVM